MRKRTRSRSRFYLRDALWFSMGITEEDIHKPKIGVVNTSNNLAICFSHLDEIAKTAQEELKKNGALPFEIRTYAPSDFIYLGHEGGYVTGGRDLISYDIEAAVEGAGLDGLICLASCDKTLPGQLIAAARTNVPTIVVACGYQPAGEYKGKRFDIEDLFIESGAFSTGRISEEEIAAMAKCAIKGPGVCQGIGTANTMHVAGEALGMCLPGSTPVLANSPKMWDTVKAACRRIVEMVEEDLCPRDILTKEAFENAAKVVLSMCGSTNSVKHLQAIAHAAERDDLDIFGMYEKFSDEVPILVGIKPNGPHSIDDFEAAGGAAGLMKQLAPKLNLDAKTVTGRTVGEELADVKKVDEEIIRPLDNAINYRPAIIIARGNVAPDTAMIKLMTDDESKENYFRGPAKVYPNEQVAFEDLNSGRLKKGDVVVLPGRGITGTPGMGGVGLITFALEGAGMRKDIAIITDGHTSGLCNAALMAVDISPEANKGGVIGLIRDGDMVVIDAVNKRVDVELTEEEIEKRRRETPFKTDKTEEKGWLKIVQEMAKPLNKGGVII